MSGKIDRIVVNLLHIIYYYHKENETNSPCFNIKYPIDSFASELFKSTYLC